MSDIGGITGAEGATTAGVTSADAPDAQGFEAALGRPPVLPPPTTALGGLVTHIGRNADDYQPSNITFSHIAPWAGARLKKRAKYEAMAERALRDLETFRAQVVPATALTA